MTRGVADPIEADPNGPVSRLTRRRIQDMLAWDRRRSVSSPVGSPIAEVAACLTRYTRHHVVVVRQLEVAAFLTPHRAVHRPDNETNHAGRDRSGRPEPGACEIHQMHDEQREQRREDTEQYAEQDASPDVRGDPRVEGNRYHLLDSVSRPIRREHNGDGTEHRAVLLFIDLTDDSDLAGLPGKDDQTCRRPRPCIGRQPHRINIELRLERGDARDPDACRVGRRREDLDGTLGPPVPVTEPSRNIAGEIQGEPGLIAGTSIR